MWLIKAHTSQEAPTSTSGSSSLNIEPSILNVYEMPIGTDLIFIEEDGDKYFINAKTNEQIREKVKSPFMIAFEKNLSFLRKDEYSKEFIENLFTESDRISLHTIGEVDFPTGQVIIADPLCYLHSEENRKILDRTIPIGKCEVELAILNSKTISKRVVGARLKIRNDKIIRYEQTQNISSSFNGFGVDAGLASFCDAIVAEEYTKFWYDWIKNNPNKNHYNNYFSDFFQEKQFVDWEIPGTNHKIAMFETGFGDGYYMSLYGLNEKDEVCELVIPFINPKLVD
ncbi:DUF4241 domain-containing protein [Fusobacterium pseudoperiodonticum]|uniref:DUF4241 domain-containing protein n=1 Tax=Fusobacterium pseudoperiodonticum TaxID=2663009 RepID=UPI001D17B9F9|nr:DUF4241 domain-containing protein [Fusobacterium pseudoperiodonticum]